jgi:hypothetical protein
MSEASALAVANVLGIAILSQIFLSIEEKSLPHERSECFGYSYSYLTKWIGKSGRNGFSAVDYLTPTGS